MLLAALWCQALPAASTTSLPQAACLPGGSISADGFEDFGPVPHDPSNGSGGAPGDVTATVLVPGYANAAYFLHVPAGYGPGRSWPLLLALHGAAGSHSDALLAAQAARDDWAALADRYGFIVLAPAGEDPSGGWIAPGAPGDYPTDYDVFAYAIAAVEAAYNVERTRRYGWGFSAGGHVLHDMLLNGFNPAVDANHLAAYGVNAGVLAGLVCPPLSVDSAACAAILAAAPRKVPFDIHIGSDDFLLSYAQSDHDLFRAQGWSDESTIYYREFSGGHDYSAVQLGEIWRHVCQYALAP